MLSAMVARVETIRLHALRLVAHARHGHRHLWTRTGDLMPEHPRSKAQPHRWEWRPLLDLAGRSGDLVPVGSGSERRA
jgi:gentisate 1,2-dioxygenase